MIVYFIACMVLALAMEPTKAEINEYIAEVAEQYEICPELIMAICEVESNYDIYAENGNCKGITQISESNHKERMEELGVTDLFDPYGNILLCVDFVAELKDKYDDVALVLMLYNMKWKSAFRIYYEEGRISSYAEKVMERSAELERERDAEKLRKEMEQWKEQSLTLNERVKKPFSIS